MNKDTIVDQIWPIIANKEAIAVSQTYAGFSGGTLQSSSVSVTLDDVNHAAMEKGMTEAELRATGPTVTASHQYLYNPLDYAGTKVAAILMNSDTMTQRHHNSCTAAAQQLHSYTAAAQQADYYLTPRSAPFQVEGVGARPYHHLHDVWAHLKPNIVKIIRDVSSDHR